MAKKKRSLSGSAQKAMAQETKAQADKFVTADKVIGERQEEKPQPASRPKISRTTDRMSISLLAEERQALDDLAADFKRKRRRDLKTSRLVRVAIKMLLDASEEEVLRMAEEVPNLERLRVKG